MSLDMNFLTAEEVNSYSPNFNPRLMDQIYVNEVLSQIHQKPIWYEEDLSEVPEINAGISICRNCRHIYWVTPERDAFKEIKGLGQITIGPFCEPCSEDISKELLERQRQKE